MCLQTALPRQRGVSLPTSSKFTRRSCSGPSEHAVLLNSARNLSSSPQNQPEGKRPCLGGADPAPKLCSGGVGGSPRAPPSSPSTRSERHADGRARRASPAPLRSSEGTRQGQRSSNLLPQDKLDALMQAASPTNIGQVSLK